MQTRFIYSSNEIGEFADQREDYSFPPSGYDQNFADMAQEKVSTRAMQHAPIGEPRSDYDVRSIFDSRPVNAYDFNNFATSADGTTQSWSATFNVPPGYRAVVRAFDVWYEVPPTGPDANSVAHVQQNGADTPNSLGVIIGGGTLSPINCFVVCEENTSYGIRGHNSNIIFGLYVVNINVYGTLIPVDDSALPFSIANKKLQSGIPEVFASEENLNDRR